jgi:hypothetical protein
MLFVKTAQFFLIKAQAQIQLKPYCKNAKCAAAR